MESEMILNWKWQPKAGWSQRQAQLIFIETYGKAYTTKRKILSVIINNDESRVLAHIYNELASEDNADEFIITTG